MRKLETELAEVTAETMRVHTRIGVSIDPRFAPVSYEDARRWAEPPGVNGIGPRIDESVRPIVLDVERSPEGDHDPIYEAILAGRETPAETPDEKRKRERRERDQRRREAKKREQEAGADPQRLGGLPVANGTIAPLEEILEAESRADALTCEDLGHKPPWTSDDLDAVLLHALGRSGAVAILWPKLIKQGATNDDIRHVISLIWPTHGRQFIPPDQGGGKHGYTIQATHAGAGMLWVGPFRGPGHEATLYGERLIHRIRDVLEIPTPTEAARLARKPASDSVASTPPANVLSRNSQPATRNSSTHVPMPADGWDSASLANAAEDLGCEPKALTECLACRAVSAAWASGVCPACGANEEGKAPAKRRSKRKGVRT